MQSRNRTINSVINEEPFEESPLLPPHRLTQHQRQALQESFERHSTLKTIKVPPTTRLNSKGLREIIYSQPQTEFSLTEKQLASLFEEACLPLNQRTITHIYGQIAKRRGKGINLEQLIKLMEQPQGNFQSQEDYQQIFRVYDKKSRGWFDFDDYRLMCQGIARQLTQQQVRAAFDKMADSEGKVDMHRFCSIMRGLS